MALMPECGSTFETPLFHQPGSLRFCVPPSNVTGSLFPMPKRFLANVEFIVTPPATPTRSAAASPLTSPVMEELLGIVPTAAAAAAALDAETDSFALNLNLPMTPPPMEYLHESSTAAVADTHIPDNVASIFSGEIFDLSEDDFEATMASIHFSNMEATMPDLSWASSSPSSHTAITPKEEEADSAPTATPAYAASDDDDDDDSEDMEPTPVPILVTTRSGRQIRQVRYESTAGSVSEPTSPVVRRRKRPAVVEPKAPRRRVSLVATDKRDSHNISERQRRRELKVSFDALRSEVPSVRDDSRVHTSTVLQMAIDYVRQLQSEDEQLQRQMEELRKVNRMLQECAF